MSDKLQLKSSRVWHLVDAARNASPTQEYTHALPNYVAFAMLDDLRTLVAEVERLRGQLDAGEWEPVEEYSEIYTEGEDGLTYTIGVDGDGNMYAKLTSSGDITVCLIADEFRLCRHKAKGE